MIFLGRGGACGGESCSQDYFSVVFFSFLNLRLRVARRRASAWLFNDNKVLAPLNYLTVLRKIYCDLKEKMFIPK